MSKPYLFPSFNEFTLFLFIYMANADGNIDQTEVDVIVDKVKKIYPEKADPLKTYHLARLHFFSFSREQVDEIILSNFNHYRKTSFSRKYKIFVDLYDIINADGIVDESENMSLIKLKTIIDQCMQHV